MIKNFCKIICILLLANCFLTGQGYFKITDDIRKAYDLAFELKRPQAEKQISYIKTTDPENLLVYHIENYLDFFEVFITEEKDRFKILEKNKDRRIDMIKKGDHQSPFYRFCQAEIHLQWALARSKFNQKFTASREILNANALLEENTALYPNFKYNYKSLSIIHVLARSIPGIIRTIFSIRGSIALGTQEIKDLYEYTLKEDVMFEEEVVVIYAYILYYQNNKTEKAWNLLDSFFKNNTPKNPLTTFVLANMGQKIGHNDQAIELLFAKDRSNEDLPFHYLDFLLGKFKLYRLDEDADKYILKFINNFKGQHFIKEAYQKMAWYRLVVHDDLPGYKRYMKLVSEKGNDLIDEDKQALKESKNGKTPHSDLLKARLLFDGGYYERAYNFLIKRAHIFNDAEDVAEYNYRLGRITQALKNYPDAINYYIKTINEGDRSSYFPCNAALQIGLIFEDQKRYNQAFYYLQKCLNFSPEEYKNSLHQKAKSAIQRIKERND